MKVIFSILLSFFLGVKAGRLLDRCEERSQENEDL